MSIKKRSTQNTADKHTHACVETNNAKEGVKDVVNYYTIWVYVHKHTHIKTKCL